MAEQDITEKNLEALNDVFADIVNVLLFDGRPVIKEDELEPAVTRSMIKADDKLHEQERDVSKFWKNGEIRISLLGFENQTKKDAKIPLRVISYDGAAYKQQLLDKTQKKQYPVVTLVLYFGTKTKWKKHRCLLDCFTVPKELEPYVSDYKINVFEIAWLSDETIAKFKSDFRIVAEFFRAKRKKVDFEGTKEDIDHIDETLKLLAALTGDVSFETVYNEKKNKTRTGGNEMDEVLERIFNKGRRKEAEEAAKKLYKNGASIDLLVKSLDLTKEEILELTKNVVPVTVS